jgi:hypothetical protein
MESRPRMIRPRILRQIRNNLLQIIIEYVGLQLSLTIVLKTNSNFKGFVEHIFHSHLANLFEFKGLLFDNVSMNLKESLALFNSYYKNQDKNWLFTADLMSQLLFTKIPNGMSIK